MGHTLGMNSRDLAQEADLTPHVGGGGKQLSDYATIGDIMNQMATAFSTPFDSEGGGTP